MVRNFLDPLPKRGHCLYKFRYQILLFQFGQSVDFFFRRTHRLVLVEPLFLIYSLFPFTEDLQRYMLKFSCWHYTIIYCYCCTCSCSLEIIWIAEFSPMLTERRAINNIITYIMHQHCKYVVIEDHLFLQYMRMPWIFPQFCFLGRLRHWIDQLIYRGLLVQLFISPCRHSA